MGYFLYWSSYFYTNIGIDSLLLKCCLNLRFEHAGKIAVKWAAQLSQSNALVSINVCLIDRRRFQIFSPKS